jgi:CRP-like cAMP-binding protein
MRQGDIASEMYFIAEGTLEVRLYEDDTGKPLANTSYSR